MEPTNKSVTRTLPIDSALVADVLLRLRRDSVGTLVRWTLGDHGTFEVDVNFTSDGTTWSTTGRIWHRTASRCRPCSSRSAPTATTSCCSRSTA